MLGARFTYKKIFTTENGNRPRHYVLMDGTPMKCIRFNGHYRPNEMYIFQIDNCRKVYHEHEIKRFKKIYHTDLVKILDANDSKITFQTPELKKMFEIKK